MAKYNAYQNLKDTKGATCPMPPRELGHRKSRNYDERRVLDFLTREKRCRVVEHGVISTNNSINLGNSSLGKLDFLRNHCGWTVVNY